MNATILFRNENINRYFADINKYNPMTDEVEKMTFARFAMGDNSAREEIIKANLRFAVSRAKRWNNNAEIVEDLIQAANIGLINAVDTFDHTKGYRFISYAVYLIDQEIYKEVALHNNMVRQTNDAKLSKKVRLIRKDFWQNEEREPSIDEIAEILKSQYSIEVKNLCDLLPMMVSYFDTANVDGEEFDALESGEIAGKVAQINAIERDMENEENTFALRKVMRRLTAKEKDIVMLAYGLNGNEALPNEEIAKRYGMTAERIRQIVQGSIKKMGLVA